MRGTRIIMAKVFLVVDIETNETVYRMMCGKLRQMYYDRDPKDHVGFVMANVVSLITITGLLLGIVEVFAPFLKSPYAFVAVGCMTGAHIIYVGICWLIEKCRDGNRKEARAKRVKVMSDIPWLDPYGLARDTADVPGKKTYYVVDSERNAVVDVIHLGKWGQKWLNRHATRQATKIGE